MMPYSLNLLDVPAHNRYANAVIEAEGVIHNLSQIDLRRAIANIESQSINAEKYDILNTIPELLQNRLREYGITIHQLIDWLSMFAIARRRSICDRLC
ncbi:MAG: hypothetical protein AAFO76_09715, partial [Cyanobacteria bacterium J06607_15]